MSKYKHHKYTWTKPFGSIRHHWELVGPSGAIHFHVSLYDSMFDGKPIEPSAGLEIHRVESPEYSPNEAPDHVNCWLTGGRCWHDGTSLYATETLWPTIKGYLERSNHEGIFKILEGEADQRFDDDVETTMGAMKHAVQEASA